MAIYKQNTGFGRRFLATLASVGSLLYAGNALAEEGIMQRMERIQQEHLSAHERMQSEIGEAFGYHGGIHLRYEEAKIRVISNGADNATNYLTDILAAEDNNIANVDFSLATVRRNADKRKIQAGVDSVSRLQARNWTNYDAKIDSLVGAMAANMQDLRTQIYGSQPATPQRARTQRR